MPELLADTETLFAAARDGDPEAFAEWMGRVERPIQASLRRFAQAIDLEVVMQETFARMWVFARDVSRKLEGPNASLRFALRVARNVALEEVRRARLGRMVSLESLTDTPEPETMDDPPAAPGLMGVIRACVEALPRRPREAILLRMKLGAAFPDGELAPHLKMTVNTFLQNIVRARRQVARCLREHGVALEELVS